jgi:hypothetical protein
MGFPRGLLLSARFPFHLSAASVLDQPLFDRRLGIGILNFCLCVPWYHGTNISMVPTAKYVVERVQTGVRLEKRLLKVLKALAEYHDMTLGDLLEGIVLHAFDGKAPFSPATLQRIRELKRFYALDLDASASHQLTEQRRSSKPGRGKRSGKERAGMRQ